LTKRQDVQTPAEPPTRAKSKKSRTSRAKRRFLLHGGGRCARNMNLVEARAPFHKTSKTAKTNYLNGAWGVLHFFGPPETDFSGFQCHVGCFFLLKSIKNTGKVSEIAIRSPCARDSRIDLQKSLKTSVK
jgi:hypothetical protein